MDANINTAEISSDEHSCLRANYEIWKFEVGTLINDDKTQGIGGECEMRRKENVNINKIV